MPLARRGNQGKLGPLREQVNQRKRQTIEFTKFPLMSRQERETLVDIECSTAQSKLQ